MCNVQKFRHEHWGYMLKKDKMHDDMKFVERHRCAKLSGVINKKNIKYYPEEKFELTEAQFEKAVDNIKNKADGNVYDLEELIGRFGKPCNHITYTQVFYYEILYMEC